MKSNAKGITSFIVMFLTMVVLCNCSDSDSTLNVSELTTTPNETLGTLEATSLPTVTQITVTNLPTEIVSPTATSLPPISLDTASSVMSNFLKTNGGCQIPCLFGLTPGWSEVADVDSLTNYFMENTMETDGITLGALTNEESGSLYLIFQQAGERVYPLVSYYYENAHVDMLTLGSEVSRLSDYQVIYDSPYGLDLLSYYLLSNMLTIYGVPSEVMIRPFPTDPNRPLDAYPFSTVLYYKEKGFLVEYISLRQEQGEYFLGCQPTSYINLVSWFPQKRISLLDAKIGRAHV